MMVTDSRVETRRVNTVCPSNYMWVHINIMVDIRDNLILDMNPEAQ